MTRPLRFLILDHNVETAKRLADSISTDGVVVYSTDDPDEARELISLLQHDILLIDVDKLIDFLIEHGIGVRKRTLDILAVDPDEFTDPEADT